MVDVRHSDILRLPALVCVYVDCPSNASCPGYSNLPIAVCTPWLKSYLSGMCLTCVDMGGQSVIRVTQYNGLQQAFGLSETWLLYVDL